MTRYLLDTDTCISFLHGNGAIADRIDHIGVDCFAISEITVAELLVGQRIAEIKGRKFKREALETFFSNIEIIPFSMALSYYVDQKAQLYVSGKPIEDFDLMIASTALSMGMMLVSGNISHMSHITGLRIEDWRHADIG